LVIDDAIESYFTQLEEEINCFGEQSSLISLKQDDDNQKAISDSNEKLFEA